MAETEPGQDVETARLPLQLGDVVVDDIGRIGRITIGGRRAWVMRYAAPRRTPVLVYHVEYHAQLPEGLTDEKTKRSAAQAEPGRASGRSMWGTGEWDAFETIINKAAAPQRAWWDANVVPLIAKEAAGKFASKDEVLAAMRGLAGGMTDRRPVEPPPSTGGPTYGGEW